MSNDPDVRLYRLRMTTVVYTSFLWSALMAVLSTVVLVLTRVVVESVGLLDSLSATITQVFSPASPVDVAQLVPTAMVAKYAAAASGVGFVAVFLFLVCAALVFNAVCVLTGGVGALTRSR